MNMMSIKDIRTLPDLDVKIEASYIKVKCTVCFNQWGISTENGKISKRDLVCSRCLLDKATSN